MTQSPSLSQQIKEQQTQYFFWSYAASQIIISLSPASQQQSSDSFACAIYDRANPACSLWLHPSKKEKQHIGQLSLTLLGQRTFVIPRNGLSYLGYIRHATETLKKTANAFFEEKLA